MTTGWLPAHAREDAGFERYLMCMVVLHNEKRLPLR